MKLEAWFGRKDVFNHSKDKSWLSTTSKIEFSDKRSKMDGICR